MTDAAPIAVVLPCRNARHLLWRSLASVAAQSLPPAQILVLDRGSADGTADWLRIRWPGVELRTVPPEADAAGVQAVIAAAVSAPRVAILPPGERWRPSHLEALAAQGGMPALVPTEHAAADLAWPSEVAAMPSPETLEDAVASLPTGVPAVLIDLRAAGMPAGLVDLLGLAGVVGGSGRSPQAWTLADLAWPALAAAPAGAPVVANLADTLEPRFAGEQLFLEELLRRCPDRPVRLVLGGIAPVSAPMLSRLLDAVLAHGDAELWLADAVSRRLAAALFGTGRVRLVAPPLLALAPLLRDLTARELIDPATLGRPAAGIGLARRLAEPAMLWEGFDPAGARRLGLVLARVTGIARWLKAPLLQQAWCATLVLWAAARQEAEGIVTGEPGTAIFAAMCGRTVRLVPSDAKRRDLVATWRPALGELGIATG